MLPTFIDIPGIQQESRSLLLTQAIDTRKGFRPDMALATKEEAAKSLFSHFILKITPQYTGATFQSSWQLLIMQEQKLMGKCRLHFDNFSQNMCLKITEKVSFNIASEASYVTILSGQKFIKNAKNGPFWRVFENLKLAVKQCYQTGQF